MKPSNAEIRRMKYHIVIPFILDIAAHKIQSDPENVVRILSLRWFKKWYMGFGL